MSKISFIVSGGVSLCTYEVGVLTSFYQLFLENDDVKFEVIGGSSAGAISTFLFVVSVFYGKNPYFMADSIIKNADIKNLVSKDDRYVLDFDNLVHIFEESIGEKNRCEFNYGCEECKKYRSLKFCKDKVCATKTDSDIKMVFNVTTLQPILKDIKDTVFSKVFTLRTHNCSFVFDMKNVSEKKLFKILKSSASFPLFFPSVKYVFKDEDLIEFSDFYKDKKIEIELTDGGVTQNLPLKIIFDNIKDSEKIILIVPHPDDLKSIIENLQSTDKGDFFDSILKLFDATFYQSYYSDLKLSFEFNRIEKKLSDLRKKIKESFENLNEDEKKVVEKFLRGSCLDVKDLGKDLSTGKKIIEIDIISPEKPSEELGGEILKHFGGFFDRRIRYNDFLVGYFDGMEYCKGLGYRIEPLFDRNNIDKTIGKIEFNKIKNKKILVILFLKFLLSFCYPYRKNFFIILIMIVLKSTIKILENFH
ncbi:MAG: patatin-like phospholipase family protein [candidate division WOR-3 bacterium]